MADQDGRRLSKEALAMVALRGLIYKQSTDEIFDSMRRVGHASDKDYSIAFAKAQGNYTTLSTSSYHEIVTEHVVRYKHLRSIAEAYDLPEVLTKIDNRTGDLFLSPDTSYGSDDSKVKLTVDNSRYNVESLSSANIKSIGNLITKCGGDEVDYKEIIFSPKLLSEFHRQIQRNLYKQSYYHFYKWAFNLKHDKGDFRDNWHIRKICNLLQDRVFGIIQRKKDQKSLLINLPPRGSKSLICNIYLNFWAWLHNANMRFVAISHGEKIITSQNKDALRLMRDPRVLNIFPELKMSSTRGKTADFGPEAGEGTRWGVPIGGQVTGVGGHILVVDDPLSATNARSTTERQKVNAIFSGTLSTRMKTPGTFVQIVVMQRLHEDDLSGHLIVDPEFKKYWDFIKLPVFAGSEEDVSPKEWYKYYKDGHFWPSYLTESVVNRMKSQLGSDFFGQFLQDPIPTDGIIIQHAWIRRESKDVIDELTQGMVTHFVVDMSLGKDDPTGCIAYRVTRGGIFCVIDAWCAKIDNPDALDKLKVYVKEFGDHRSIVYIEFDNIGQLFMQWLNRQETVGFNYQGIDIPGKRDSKPQRLTSVSSSFANSKVIFQDNTIWIEEMVRQITSFPNVKHDEYVDCVAWMLLLNKPTEILFDQAMMDGDASSDEGGAVDIEDDELSREERIKRLMPPGTEWGGRF